ncbi:helix-turn-helix domain-containing protein [Jiella sp. MQZ9-1]|uniref:Helix-turn-helix transcriptional regulator n=1 Tax=Jiella flava TaxID=2816857 RepID=A0A939JWX7_9HYPH|nr:helix-turn-helix transcriptional regulator [Jiella flava]MBO0663487.1 helix-turn-helix transcriptional regulator [Jiella flava]MCD2472062.1 helix-turn-helix domain-containing protein [Jiella flava]
MTPFGEKVRALRRERNITQQDMARALGVSSAYLSALEHGRRGRPTWAMLQRIIGYLNVIWDDAEELERLAELSDPKIVVDTGGLSPVATRLANRLAESITSLNGEEVAQVLDTLERVSLSAEARRKARLQARRGR